MQCCGVKDMGISVLVNLTHHLSLMPNLSLFLISKFSYEQKNSMGTKFHAVRDGPLESLA